MGLGQLIKIDIALAKAQGIAREKGVMPTVKFSQLAGLIIKLAANLGGGAVIAPILSSHAGVSEGVTWAVLIVDFLHALAQALAPSLTQKADATMKTAGVVLMALILGHTATAQAPAPSLPQNFYALGVSYNNGASPAVAGTGLYARLVTPTTYAFGVYDALPATVKPFTVTSNFGGGIAQKIFSVGTVDFYIPTSAGISFSGSNTGWQWTTGVLAPIKVKGNFRICPTVRIIKSSVSGGTGYQPIGTILVGWGK
jgi:hypothetical protein